MFGVRNYVPNVSLTCGGVHPGWVSTRELTTSRIEAYRSCPSSLVAFTQSFLRRMQLKTRGPENSSRPSLSVLAHVLKWTPVRLRCVQKEVTLWTSGSVAKPEETSLDELCASSPSAGSNLLNG